MTPPAASPAAPLPRLAPGRFREAVELSAGLDAYEEDAERREALRTVLHRTAEEVERGLEAGALLAALPRRFADVLGTDGWGWNGFYALGPDGRLHLGHAFGPPVCAELERRGGPLSSGMCFDGVLLNQTLAVPRVGDWPGYVSCDAESGLSTVGGIVSPLRDPEGRPIGVWDLDCTRPVTAGEGRFADSLFATLARTLELHARDLGFAAADAAEDGSSLA